MALRVGVVTGNFLPTTGGTWTFSSTLRDALENADSQHEFVILDAAVSVEATNAFTPTHGLGLLSRSRVSAVKKKTVSLGRRLTPQSVRRIITRVRRSDQDIQRLQERLERERIDLVWFIHPFGKPLSTPYIATVWDLEHRKQPYFPEVSYTGWTWSAREKLYSTVLPRASLIITGTQAGKEEVTRYYNVNPDNVAIIPFPAPRGAPQAPSAAKLGIMQKFGIKGDFVIFPAQFWPHKNHANLLRALAIFRDDQDLNLNLILTGGDHGKNLHHVSKMIKDLNLSDRVMMLGFVSREDLEALYLASIALVYPSYFGPDNLPPLEAFALGCPVIAANVRGAEEQLRDAALLFNPSDPSDIAEKISEVYKTPELRARMVSKGRDIVMERTPEAYIAAVCSFVDKFEAIRRCWPA